MNWIKIKNIKNRSRRLSVQFRLVAKRRNELDKIKIIMITFGYKGKFSGPVRGVVALVLGTVMLFVGNAVDLIVYIVASFMLISGLLSLYAGIKTQDTSRMSLVMVNSGLNVLIAVLMFIFASELGNFVVGVIGFIMVLLGLLQLLVIGSASRAGGMAKGFFAMPAVVLACGALLLFKPGFVGDIIGVLAGVSFILYGISELVSSKKLKTVISQMEQQPSQPVDGQADQDVVKDVDYEKVDEQ